MTGGTDVNDKIRNVLKKLIIHELALVINWIGKNGKRGFYSLAFSNECSIRNTSSSLQF